MLLYRYLVSMKRIIKFAMVIGVFWVITEPARGIGLGDITVFSSTNEPLYAELNILGASIENTKDVSYGLMTTEHLERFPISSADINLSLKISDKDLPVIVVSTVNPILSDVVGFTVFISEDDKKVYSSYLLQLSSMGEENTGTVRVFSAMPKESQKTIDEKFKVIALNTSYGPVEQSENLIIIAKRLVISSPLSIYQKLYALLKNNDHAFIQGNMNLLRAGVFIDIPSIKEFELTSRILAIETYTQQVAEWQEYRLRRFPKTLNQHSVQPIDPSIAFMNTTVDELKKEIERLRVMLDESAAEKTRAFELKKEETEFRKSLEKDIKRLEQSKSSLLETISSIMESVDDSNKAPTTLDEMQSVSQNQARADISASDIRQEDAEFQQLQELRKEMLSVEAENKFQRTRNQSMEREIEELKKERERADEILEEKGMELALAQREAAVYSAALESLDTKIETITSSTGIEDQTSEINLQENHLTRNDSTTLDQESGGSARVSSQEEKSNIVSEAPSINIYFWLAVGFITGSVISGIIILSLNRQKSSKNMKAINDVDDNFDDLDLETKLDLAKAYIEMDQNEKARELLREVKTKGNIAQRTEAEDTLNVIK